MSLHIETTPEAAGELKKQIKRNKAYSILVTLLCCFLGGIILYSIVKLFENNTSITFEPYIPPLEAPISHNRPVIKNQQARPSSPANSISPSIIISTASSHISMADIDIPSDSTDFGTGLELGVGFGNGNIGNNIGTNGTGLGEENAGGSTLEGTFYDLKQTPSGAPTVMNAQICKQVLTEFNKSGWDKSILAKYYQAPTKLYTSCFYMPICRAEEAPYAYKVQDKVKASQWVAVYRGKVKAPKSGKFRFIGLGDDSLAVRFNKKLVFDYGWSSVATGQMIGGNHTYRNSLTDNKGEPRKFFPYSGCASDWNPNLGGLSSGDIFEVKAGETYPIEILISEVPGGYFGFVLLIEDMDSPPAKKDSTGSPIFQLFRTNFAEPNTEELYKNMKAPGDKRSDVPYDKDSLIWQSV